MGFDIDRFSGPVDEDFKCSICLGVLENPLATPCGHVFCSNCVLPWVVQNGSCPLKCEKFSTKELNSVLPLRNLILKLEIRCDNFRRGCPEEVKIQMLGQHMEDCDFAPVKCSNKGCQDVINIQDQAQHETQTCEFRPVGRCEQGCSLVLQFNTRSEHDCLKALQNHSGALQSKIKNQEHNLKKNSLRYGKREKALLAQIACLQNEIQMQALRYQKKLNESKAEMEYMSAVASFEKPWENTTILSLRLSRQDGSLGFNIIGGSGISQGDGGISEGIIVSRVNEKGPADRSQLQVHDRMIEVNGQDLSKATHEEAVEAFKNAQEPIIVQVMRRSACTAKNGSTTPNGQGSVPSPLERTVCSVGTQTELQNEDLLWKVLQRCSLPPSENHCDGTLDGLCDLDAEDPLSVLDSELLQKLEAMEGNLDLPILDEEDCLDRAYEMEYEDIVLKRSNTKEKLGLTLCYGSEEDSGIFISEIDLNSIAYDDGRLKEGDQILQINGEDVINKDQALSLFLLQTPCTSLLVCRPQLRFEDCLYEGNALLDDLQMDMLEQTHQEAMQFTACLLHSEGRPDDDGTTDTGTTNTSNHLEKDSGVGRATDESTRHDESSEQEILVDDASINQKFPVDTTRLGSGGDLRYSNDSFTSNSTAEHDFMGHDISVEECMKFQAALESKCDNKHLRSDTDESMKGKETKVMRLGSDSMDTTSQSGDSLNRPCRNRLICDQQDELQKEKRINGHDVWLSNHAQDEQLDTIPCQCPSSESSQKVDMPEKDNSHQRQEDLSPETKEEANKENGLPSNERQHRRSSSGSGRSHRAPRTVPGSPGGRSKSSSSSRDRSKSTSSSGSTKGSGKDKHSSPSKGASTNNGETNHKHQQTQQQQQQQQQQDHLGQLPGAKAYPRSPATNPHLRAQFSQRSPYLMQHDSTRTNLLKHNWKVQQQASQLKRSFDKYGSIQSLQSVPGYAKHYRSYLHLINQNEENAMKSQNNSQGNSEGQWKVKIRSDGTRYITKRSSRDRLLKERATKIQEERAGMTTDDEAVSEMKLGRYWSKEDRKRHLERAKDQRLRREYMQQARMECLQELEEDILSGGGKREPDIVELSHRKLNKRKGRKMMLDDFTTVQEMLIHGSKVSPDSAKEFSPFLNVTMV